MICTENIHRITKYFLLSILILFHLSVAQDEKELSLENHDGMSWKPPRRHLLWSSHSSSSMDDGPKIAIYIVALVIITFISVCCKYCIKQTCEVPDDYSDAIVHPPPRRNFTSPVLPSSGRRVLNPPRSSSSIILPPEEGVYSVDFTGIENPNYNPSINVPAPNYYSPTVPQYSTNDLSNYNPTPILDLPPSYESVMKEQKYPNEK